MYKNDNIGLYLPINVFIYSLSLIKSIRDIINIYVILECNEYRGDQL